MLDHTVLLRRSFMEEVARRVDDALSARPATGTSWAPQVPAAVCVCALAPCGLLALAGGAASVRLLRRIAGQPHEVAKLSLPEGNALRAHLIRHRGWWNDVEHANALDELEWSLDPVGRLGGWAELIDWDESDEGYECYEEYEGDESCYLAHAPLGELHICDLSHARRSTFPYVTPRALGRPLASNRAMRMYASVAQSSLYIAAQLRSRSATSHAVRVPEYPQLLSIGLHSAVDQVFEEVGCWDRMIAPFAAAAAVASDAALHRPQATAACSPHALWPIPQAPAASPGPFPRAPR